MSNLKKVGNDFIDWGISGLILNGIYQTINCIQNPNEQFDMEQWLKIGFQSGLVGAGISVTSLILDSIFNDNNETHLEEVLKSYDIGKQDEFMIKKGYKIVHYLENEYDATISFQGSIPDGTSLSGYSDLDIRIEFSKDGFRTLKDMIEDVTAYFKKEFCDTNLVKVRKQNSSAGLIFNDNGKEIIIDIVPARRDNYLEGANTYNLYKRNRGKAGNPTRVKINPEKQNDFGVCSKEEKNVIRLLKLLKYQEELPLKSILIKEFTKKVFDENCGNIPFELKDQVLMTLDYIESNIETAKIASPDNSNNILTNQLSDRKKKIIANKAAKIKIDLKKNDAWEDLFQIKDV